MAELSHNSKKTINRVTTLPRTINAALNQEFVDTKRRLSEVSESLKVLKRSIKSTRQTWNTVVRQQRDFAARLSASFPEAGEVATHAAEVEVAVRDVQREMILSDGEASPHYRIMEVIDRYQELLNGIAAEYRHIETLCTEHLRYERKVDSLEKRTGFRKNPDRLERNLDKLADARKDLEGKVDATIRRMRSAFQKYDAVLQCAHHAFWMANNTYLATIEEATREIRSESVNVHKLLIDIEFDENKQLMPIPRRNLIEPNNDSDSINVDNQGYEDRPVESISTPATPSLLTAPNSASDLPVKKITDGKQKGTENGDGQGIVGTALPSSNAILNAPTRPLPPTPTATARPGTVTPQNSNTTVTSESESSMSDTEERSSSRMGSGRLRFPSIPSRRSIIKSVKSSESVGLSSEQDNTPIAA